MSTRTRDNTLQTLNLPDTFEDLSGLISADLRVIATALAERAGDRLCCSRRGNAINCGASSGTN